MALSRSAAVIGGFGRRAVADGAAAGVLPGEGEGSAFGTIPPLAVLGTGATSFGFGSGGGCGAAEFSTGFSASAPPSASAAVIKYESESLKSALQMETSAGDQLSTAMHAVHIMIRRK